jgi:nitroreductase
MSSIDKYQERYLAHQARKKDVLIEIVRQRHSNRMFAPEPVSDKDINELLMVCDFCPSSCDRLGIDKVVVNGRDDKNLLGGLLVGGVGWIHRSSHIILLFADRVAYKAGDEVGFMPYLDAGVVIQQLYLTATSMGLHCAYANPNIRERHRVFMEDLYGDRIFCGAFAVGHPFES